MMQFQPRQWILYASFALIGASVARPGELPTAEEILRIHLANQSRLAQRHARYIHREETTAASCRAAQRRLASQEKFLQVAKGNPQEVRISADGRQLAGVELQRMVKHLEQDVKTLRRQTKPFQSIEVIEYFQDGDDYQLRDPLRSFKTAEELATWSFPESRLTPEALLAEYRDMSIFSRSAKTTPAGRWWHHSADGHAVTTQQHLTDLQHIELPPFTAVTHPQWDVRHHYDAFFSQSADKYRIVRQEENDGRLLTVVDVAVPLAEDDESLLAYRAWLDLKRGAIPMKLYHLQNVKSAPKDQFDHTPPREIVTTREVRELPNGGFYPATTVCERWERDPDAPEPTAAEWDEIRAGRRKLARAVFRRHTWECSLIEIKTDYEPGFFVIPFPKGQKVYDHDAGKIVRALDEKPLVRVGQPAPPLAIAQWLDGKSRTLDDLKGQVVVLDFWGLWCGACRGSVPKLKEIQAHFHDKPVTFVSVHTAEKNSPELAMRIRKFKEKEGWKFLGAIDQGRMLKDSATSNAYGIRGYPTMVIIGRDGHIAYVDDDGEGPACNETDPAVLAAFERKFDDFWKMRFAVVGERWPLADSLDENQQQAIFQRVEIAFVRRQIESAIAKQERDKN